MSVSEMVGATVDVGITGTLLVAVIVGLGVTSFLVGSDVEGTFAVGSTVTGAVVGDSVKTLVGADLGWAVALAVGGIFVGAFGTINSAVGAIDSWLVAPAVALSAA